VLNVKLIRLIALGWFLAFVGNPASAQSNDYWAVLVGVTEYPVLTEVRPLRGPARDVLAMRDSLQRARAGWREMLVLADGVDRPSGMPTRGAIVEALERVAKSAGENDTVVFYFSGYGSQQPEDIILPRDAGKWSQTAGSVQNAISRSELNALFAPLLSKGARVWAIFDTAHSGAARGASGGTMFSGFETPRWVRPAELGVPASAGASGASAGAATNTAPGANAVPGANVAPSASAALGTNSAPSSGQLIVFSASQSDESTPELKLPPGDQGSTHRGLFTFALSGALVTSGPATYEQLAQQVMVRYAALSRVSPTPRFEGMLDTPVPILGTRRALGGHVDALRRPMRARVSGLRLCDSALASSPCNGERSNAGDREVRDRVEKLILTPSKRGILPIDLVSDPQDADVVLFMHQGRVSFVSPMDDYDLYERSPATIESSSVEKDADLERELSNHILAIATTSWLHRLGETQQPNVGLTFQLSHCGSEPLSLHAPPQIVQAGEALCAVAENGGKDPVDVTVLRVSEDYTITALLPADKEPNRIEAGSRREIRFDVVKGELPTLERLIALAVPARKGAPQVDFTWATRPGGKPAEKVKLDSVWVRSARWVAAPGS
jgi:hypothetical protein